VQIHIYLTPQALLAAGTTLVALLELLSEKLVY